MVETTAFGAAFTAGYAIGVWDMCSVKPDCDTFLPTITKEGNHFV